jgi:hypothetical protein
MGPGVARDVKALSFEDAPRVVARRELQLRAADFNAKEGLGHDQGKPRRMNSTPLGAVVWRMAGHGA